jgi:hypothetical protein
VEEPVVKARTIARLLAAIYKREGFSVSKLYKYPCGYLEGVINFTVFRPDRTSLGFLLVGDSCDVMFWGENKTLLEAIARS